MFVSITSIFTKLGSHKLHIKQITYTLMFGSQQYCIWTATHNQHTQTPLNISEFQIWKNIQVHNAALQLMYILIQASFNYINRQVWTSTRPQTNFQG